MQQALGAYRLPPRAAGRRQLPTALPPPRLLRSPSIATAPRRSNDGIIVSLRSPRHPRRLARTSRRDSQQLLKPRISRLTTRSQATTPIPHYPQHPRWVQTHPKYISAALESIYTASICRGRVLSYRFRRSKQDVCIPDPNIHGKSSPERKYLTSKVRRRESGRAVFCMHDAPPRHIEICRTLGRRF